MQEKNILEEAQNVARNAPVWPGDVISHTTASECAARGWIERDKNDFWVPTKNCPFTVVKAQ